MDNQERLAEENTRESLPSAQQQPKKRKPTQQQLRDARNRRIKNNLSSMVAVLIVFLGFYLVFSLVGAGLVYYSFHSTAKNDDTYALNVVYDETVLHKIDEEEANNEYGLYVPFEYLAEIGTFGLAGDGDDVTLFIIGTDNRIKCTKNSSLIVINDNPIRISSPILYEEWEEGKTDYLIPISLLENYINGIEVSYDKETMVCSISSSLTKADVSLSLLLPDPAEAPYFPEDYKYYDYEQSDGTSNTP